MELVRFVGKKACTSEGYQEAIADSSRAVLDTLPKGGNIILRFKLNDKPLSVVPDPHTRDLMDLAVAVYIADELVAREKAADGWARKFDYLIPVKNPAAWEAATDTLSRTLTHLAGDSNSFTWPERSALPSLGNHKKGIPRGFDAVCLFSGGIDSLLGAYKLISEGKKVLLVGHQADGTTAHAQTRLASILRQQFPTRAAFIQCRVSRGSSETQRYHLSEKVEETHRPRSFLFLSLAVAIANTARVKEIYIPENGLIALNSPLQISRVGSLSTRTAHPVFLANFLEVIQKIGVYDGSIKNPFMYESKTDMIRDLDPHLRDLVVKSISCARPSRYKQMKVNHCGYCVPCIYRRIAMMEGDLDRASDYAFDVFNAFTTLTEHTQADFRALVVFARRIVDATPLGRDMMVLAHGPFPTELGGLVGPSTPADYSPWSDMMLRWAEDFLSKVARHANADARAIIGMPMAKESVAL